MSNATLRKRMGIKDSNYPLASQIIRDAVDAKLIRPHGATVRNMSRHVTGISRVRPKHAASSCLDMFYTCAEHVTEASQASS